MPRPRPIYCYTCGAMEKVTPRSFPEGWVLMDEPVAGIPGEDKPFTPTELVACVECAKESGLMAAIEWLREQRGTLHRVL